MSKVQEKIRVKVGDLHGESTVAVVEKAVFRLKGVRKVRVDLAKGEVQISYDPSDGTTQADLEEAIRQAGFTPHAISGEEEEIEKKARVENRGLSMRLFVAALFTIPVIALELGAFDLPAEMGNFSVPASGWILLALSIPVLFIAGGPVYLAAVRVLRYQTANTDTLVALGTGSAFIYSSLAVAAPAYWEQAGLEPQTYFGVATVVMLFILTGTYLENQARGKTSEALKILLGLQPRTARLVAKDGEKTVAVSRIRKEQMLSVRPADQMPFYGEILEGAATIDESMITGDPLPVEKGEGDEVIGGTVNQAGTFTFVSKRVGSETGWHQIVEMVREARSSKPPLVRMADLFSSYFVPAILLIAIVTFTAWFIFAPNDPLTLALITSASVLIIACPCALGLAAPMAIKVGIKKAAQKGLLIRSIDALGTVRNITHIVLDKTGTLTVGEPRVTDLLAPGRYSEEEVLQMAASVERDSDHPLAEAILARAKAEGIELQPSEHFQAFPGLGVTAVVDGKAVLLGNRDFVEEMGIYLAPAEEQVEALEAAGKTVLFVGEGEDLVGLIGIADTVRENAPEAVDRLKKLDLEVAMVTGDHPRTAHFIADQIGIDVLFANLRPHEKVERIRELQADGARVAMVGEGINDAPALAAADVGIAISSGTDLALEVGGIALLKSDLNGIPDAVRLSSRTVRTVKQNLFLAFIFNLLAIPLAAGAFYPHFSWFLDPRLAAGVMGFGALTVVINSLRLRCFR